MTLQELKARAGIILVASPFIAFIIAITSGGEAIVLALLVGSIGGLALLTWIAAVVADATVHTTKKEN